MAVKKGTAKATTAKKTKKPPRQKTLSAARKTSTAKSASVKKAPVKARATKPTTAKTKAANTKAARPKVTGVRERFSKTEIIGELASKSDLTRKQVTTVLNELATLVERHVKKRSVGEFVLAGLIKIHTVKRPAKKARVGINPFTGEETTFKACPASVAVKVHALKGLKDMAQ